MAHKAQLENRKYRNWVRAGLGIKYVKEGLEPFCDHLVKQQHIAILDKVKQKHNLSTVSCGLCDVHTLQPDHIQTKPRQCHLGQMYCNCLYPRGKTPCPNKVCGAIHDAIIQLHASTPPAPYWRNADAHQWCTEPWAVAKCFINAPGYEQKINSVEFDLTGLLHVLINNIEFQQQLKCVVTGTDVFSRVRMCRNDIFHSHTMEVEDTEVNSYIDDMIELLEDETEIKHRQESKAAVKKLQELKLEDFIISTADEAGIRRVAMDAINKKERELEQTIADAGNKLKTTADEEKHDIEGKSLVIKSELEETGQKIRKDLVIKEAELEQTGQKIEKELAIKEDESKRKIEQKGNEIRKLLTRKEEEVKEKLDQKLQESKLQLESQKILIEESMTNSTETRKEAVTRRVKTDFQKKLVKLYETHVRKIAPLPRLHKDLRNVHEMYVPPWMTVKGMNEESNECKAVKISIHDIFRRKERPAKNIYVIGETGSGKTTFCKILVHFWCIAHPYQEYNLNVSDMEKEMESFEFLFYVSLRHFSDCDSIENMLKKSYSDPALGDILQNDSGKCLIIIDGLDEWNPERKHSSQFLTPGLPGRNLDADYTIITTSRQWKFDSLPLSDSTVDKNIKLNGIDTFEMRHLTEKTVEALNDIHQKCKNAEKCIIDLQSSLVSDISHTPMVLQQLVCLWFIDKLKDNSRCAIYRSMLDLFLAWKALGTSEVQKQLDLIDLFSRNTQVTQYLSYLAYET
ncbi:uncharacterized protein LOC128548797 [Mercenaria mercenaria]|uniref:uncharacterized protein LOC128548797 n=1 Tax=Mercenaria mercenaria TaxID=6596 RepID=UPI00234EA635|nr:uncharacterized protein LOC128548797 [Mercenaria mercenaria]